MRGSTSWPTCLPAADSVAVDVASRTAVSVRGRAVGAAPAADKDPPVGGGGDGHPYQCVPDAPVQFRRHQHSQPFCLGLILPLRTIRIRIRIRIRIPHCRIHCTRIHSGSEPFYRSPRPHPALPCPCLVAETNPVGGASKFKTHLRNFADTNTPRSHQALPHRPSCP
jgi:hypothetical protein